ncbi:glycoside hydrolase family protein [uncultured Draconibacterium sp.]|uniref:glycoside hydrolase family protein n=1 Tax=uncultured Draconibacterium sp. TaxID=1573823 RepID=UPI0032171BA6
MKRRNFIQKSTIAGGALLISGWKSWASFQNEKYTVNDISDFSKRLKPLGRILELDGYYVWGCSPIVAPDGKVHVFFSRWSSSKGMGGWINSSEIAHAVADQPDGPYYNIETILAPRGEGYFDGTTCHNPHIQYIDGKYFLFYIGNSNRKTNTKRIAVATSESLNGPWKRPDQPLLEVGEKGAWDDHCTSNPSFIKHPNGQYWLYYKAWNDEEYMNPVNPKIRGNRKYGLAIAEKPEGPYLRYSENPIIDYSSFGNNRQLEDGNVFMENGKFYMLARDMGRFDHEVGIILESDDGIHWSEPKISYFGVSHYIDQAPKPKHLSKYGRFERPQILLQNGEPTHLFVTTQGGKFESSSPFVFKID